MLFLGLATQVPDLARARETPAPVAASAQSPAEVRAVVQVEASRLGTERVVKLFVDELTRRPRDDSAAVWNRRLCPLVAGLARDQAEFLLQRISAVALDAGVPLGERDCKPNLLVVVAANPRDLLERWQRRDDDPFSHASRAKIAAFVESGRPVRAWYNVERIGADGVALLQRGSGEAVAQVGRLPNTRL